MTGHPCSMAQDAYICMAIIAAVRTAQLIIELPKMFTRPVSGHGTPCVVRSVPRIRLFACSKSTPTCLGQSSG